MRARGPLRWRIVGGSFAAPSLIGVGTDGMRLSPAGLAWLKREEGMSLTAYPDPKLPPLPDGSPDPKQKYSIGYGHSGAYRGQTITREQAEALLVQDLRKYEQAVSDAVPEASQAQFDAMVVLAYNIGVVGFGGSTVARLHAAGDYEGAARAFGMWRKSAGAINPVLVARREREANVYLGRGYPGSGVWSPVPVSSPVASPAPSPSPVPLPSTEPRAPINPMPWLVPGATATPGLSPLVVGLGAAALAWWALPRVAPARRLLAV